MRLPLLLIVLAMRLLSNGWAADEATKAKREMSADPVPHLDAIVLPGSTNPVQFILYTNASPASSHLFNTFEIQAWGEKLLTAPAGDGLNRWLTTSSSNVAVHNILIDGAGPELAASNGMTVFERASGPGWCYIALDACAAYRGRLGQFQRRLLFVEPDLFVLCDHLEARESATFQMLLHPSASMRVDEAWGDLRLDLPSGGLTIHSLGRGKRPCSWERVESLADPALPDSVSMELARTDRLSEFDLVTVISVHPGGQREELAFKFLESDNAIGARIHREGAPTLAAFRKSPSGVARLAGFDFSGPAGVYVFKPKQRSR